MSRYATAVLADAPALYWRLGSGAVTDSSGNGLDGTVSGEVTTGADGLLRADADGGALFGAAGGTIDQDATSTVPQSVSIECWLQTTEATGGLLATFESLDATQRDLTLYLRPDGTLAFACGATEIVAPGVVNDGRRYHVVADLSAEQASIRVNGVVRAGPVGISYRGAVLASAPRAYFPLDEAAAPFVDRIAEGEAGAYDLAVVGGTLSPSATGPFAASGDACAFTGSGHLESTSAPAGIDLGGAWTVEGWITVDGSVLDAWLSWFYYGTADQSAYLDADYYHQSFGSPDLFVDVYATASGGPRLNEPAPDSWHHLVFASSGGEAHGYVDGVRASESATYTFSDPAPPSPLFALGDFPAGATSEPFSGALAHVAFYDHRLGDGAIARHYAASALSAPASFTGRWRLGGGSTDGLVAPPSDPLLRGTLDEAAIYTP